MGAKSRLAFLAGWALLLLPPNSLNLRAVEPPPPLALPLAATPSETVESKPTVALPTLSAPQLKFTPLELARFIDEHIHRQLQQQKIPASPIADDAEYLRRVSLDVSGALPTPARAAAFFESNDPSKRTRVVSELLSSSQYVRHMTDIWRELLIPTSAASMRREHDYMIRWLEAAFVENKPWNQVMQELLTATGYQHENGAVTFFITHQSLDEITDRVARVMLGVQIQCAQCHNHPFQDWKQDEYWGLAAFFSRIRPQYKKIDNVEYYGTSELGDRKTLMTPPSLKVVPATYLRGEEALLPKNDPALPKFAEWLTSSENPWFARAIVNRTWRKFFGQGLVEPVDDLRSDNAASHPEVFDELTRQFVAHGHDLKYLVHAITATQAYQRTSRTVAGNEADRRYFSHLEIKILTPYQLHDAFMDVIASANPTPPEPAKISDDPRQAIKDRKRDRGSRDSFANYFQGEEGAPPTSYQAGLPQALRLMNSKDNQRMNRAGHELRARFKSPAEAVEFIYLAALTRKPTAEESTTVLAYLKEHQESASAYSDIVWALLNGSEFIANH